MIQHCCDANCFFDAKEARSKAKAFRSKGARKATLKLIKAMQIGVSPHDSLLDIGGGVGAIGLQLTGLTFYTSVDASTAYQEEARKLFLDNNWEINQLRFITGDFVEEAPELTQHQHVSLDKVICCYPEMKPLLKASAEHAEKQIGLVYPQTSILASIFQKFANLYFKLRQTAFRTYLHKPGDVQGVLANAGFSRIVNSRSFPWRVEVWKREN